MSHSLSAANMGLQIDAAIASRLSPAVMMKVNYSKWLLLVVLCSTVPCFYHGLAVTGSLPFFALVTYFAFILFVDRSFFAFVFLVYSLLYGTIFYIAANHFTNVLLKLKSKTMRHSLFILVCLCILTMGILNI